jgi:hypothetical protein
MARTLMKVLQRSGLLAHFAGVPYPQVILAPPGVRSMQRDFMKAYDARAKAQAKDAEEAHGVGSSRRAGSDGGNEVASQ